MDTTDYNEEELITEVHDGADVLIQYHYPKFMEIEDDFRVRYLDRIIEIYEYIREWKSDIAFFLDNMSLGSFIDFCLRCSVITITYVKEEEDEDVLVVNTTNTLRTKPQVAVAHCKESKSFADALTNKK